MALNEAILRQWAGLALSARPFPNPLFPPSPYYRFLKVLAMNLQPKLSVELGVCGGGGSLHLAMGWARGKVIGVDITYDHPEHIKYIQDKYSNFQWMLGDSCEVVQGIYDEFGEIDILFIDTLHTYQQTMKEFNTYKPFLSDKAVVCLDDLLRPGMSQAWREMPDNKLRLDMLHDGAENGGGFGVVWIGG